MRSSEHIAQGMIRFDAGQGTRTNSQQLELILIHQLSSTSAGIRFTTQTDPLTNNSNPILGKPLNVCT